MSLPSWRTIGGPLVALLGGALGTACSDLFHSTADVRTGCEIDAAARAECVEATRDAASKGDAGDGSDSGNSGSDLCAVSPAQARERAIHACAWLGACETPMGRNAFGTCLLQALLAYDCGSNPNHRVNDSAVAHDLWACLESAQTCAAVDQCVLPPGTPGCQPGDYADCIHGVRIECAGGAAYGENCALWGQACSGPLGSAVCGAGGSFACDPGVPDPQSCAAGSLYCGPDGGALAIDCTATGAGTCAELPPNGPPFTWLACVPQDVGDGGACTPSRVATCSGGAASSCPAGLREGLDCAALLNLGAAEAANACQPGMLVPSFDWTSPCQLNPPQCDADLCGGDGGPSGTILLGCVRGATAPVDCAAEGLGPCRTVATDLGTAERPACTPPADAAAADSGQE